MWTVFSPSFTGVHKPDRLSSDFIAKLAKRIRSAALFPFASKRRNQYRTVEQTEDSLWFRSTGLLTGINIGLNDVRIHIHRNAGEIRYDVSYWTWGKYCIYLCLGPGLLLGLFLVTPFFGLYVFPADWYPPLKVIKTWGIPSIIFWGLIWPWMLIQLHKRAAAKCLTRIFDEVNEQDNSENT